MDLTLSNLVRTFSTYFRIGTFRLKDASGVAQVRNGGDTAFASLGMLSAKIHGTNATNSVVLQAPDALGATVTLTLPPTDGASNQFLKTDGSGILDWADANSNSDLVQVEAFTEATSSPVTIFTPSANAIITKVAVEVSVAASGGSPTISVGISGTVDRDMTAAENDLKTVGLYETTPYTAVGGSPAAVIATITPSAQTFTGKVYIYYTNPA